MAVTIHEEWPDLGLALVQDNVPPLLGAVHGLDGAGPALQVALPYPIYTAPLESVLQNRLLASAKQTAWQYVVYAEQAPVGVAEVALETAPEAVAPLSYAAYHSDTYAAMVLHAIEAAVDAVRPSGKDYGLRILRAPSLTLLAVWLHGPEDLLFPIRPTRGVSEQELTEALRPVAQTRLTATDI
jgi:hypothetical protein